MASSKAGTDLKYVTYDVVVIGGGVIGCAILHELTRHGYRCVLAEKENALISGASSGNSGIAHTGFDATPNTVEAQLLAENQMLLSQLNISNLPLRRIGAIVVAWTVDELPQLESIQNHARSMGVANTKRLSREELQTLEPNLSTHALGGLLVPGEATIDSWMLPTCLAHDALRNGSHMILGCQVLSGSQQVDGSWLLATSQNDIHARVVVNAAGLYGDIVEGICQQPSFSIKPRKGQFVVYGKEAGKLLHHIILPVPSIRTKGIIVYPSVHGNLVVGPTAEDCSERERPSLSDDVSQQLIEQGQKVIPLLWQHDIIAVYAGIRPATETKDYHLYVNKEKCWVTVGGIRSTGVSSCLAVARHVCQLIGSSQLPLPVNPRQTTSQTLLLPSPGAVTWWATSDGSTVVMDGVAYVVTHPLTQLGLATREQVASKRSKSRL